MYLLFQLDAYDLDGAAGAPSQMEYLILSPATGYHKSDMVNSLAEKVFLLKMDGTRGRAWAWAAVMAMGDRAWSGAAVIAIVEGRCWGILLCIWIVLQSKSHGRETKYYPLSYFHLRPFLFKVFTSQFGYAVKPSAFS
jgi:hypothetical protein